MQHAKSKNKFVRELDKPPIRASYNGAGKLNDKVAIITGGDSGIGRSVAIHFAREGADVVIVYDKDDAGATETCSLVEAEGKQCIRMKGDISKEAFCKKLVADTVKKLGGLDILVNNAGTHEEDLSLSGISQKQLIDTFSVNMFSMFYLCKYATEVMTAGGAIINTSSVTAYRGSEHLMDYAATKGAIVSFTRSLAKNLAEKKIRVNAVAPGPVWTPLVIASFEEQHLAKFGKNTPLGRAGYPYELAPAYVYLASDDSSYMTGQVLHINGGDIVGG